MVSGESDGKTVLQPGEMLMLNSATATSVGVVFCQGKDATLNLRLPICALAAVDHLSVVLGVAGDLLDTALLKVSP